MRVEEMMLIAAEAACHLQNWVEARQYVAMVGETEIPIMQHVWLLSQIVRQLIHQQQVLLYHLWMKFFSKEELSFGVRFLECTTYRDLV